MVADNTPIIVGSSQLVDREATIERHSEPLAMLTNSAKTAAQDAGITESALAGVDTVALVGVSGWNPQNAPGLLAEQLQAKPNHLFSTGVGGQMGVQLTNYIGERILAGESEFATIGGCNNLRVLLKAIAQKTRLQWTRGGTGTPDQVGGDEPGNNDLENKYGLNGPTDIYPIFENAFRAKLGLSIDQHKAHMGSLFSKFTEVAEQNPYAWFPTRRSSEELTKVTQLNRMIAWPYPKYLNAVLNTEQAATLIMMSAGKARKLGIPEDKWVYWLGGASSQEKAWWASERPDFAECPSMKDTLVSSLENSATSIEELDYIDFYSCFPIAVEMACAMSGLDISDKRGFTVTGGLPYAGGPASAYTLHSLATLVNKLRGKTSEKGLVTGNGWYLTKHAAAVLSSDPHVDSPKAGLIADLPSLGMNTDACIVNEKVKGSATIEAYTVKYDRDGSPDKGIVLGRTDEGERFMSNTIDDQAFLSDFVSAERVGTRGTVNYVAGSSLFTPD